MSNICLLDIESTGVEAMCCEMITAYFHCTEFDNYEFRSQVSNWSYEAEKIHGISEMEMLTYAPKSAALGALYLYLTSLPKDTLFVCYSNTNQMGQHYCFDSAVIRMQFELHGYKFDMSNIVSAHTMVKEAHKRGLFKPQKRMSATGKTMNDFTQSGVFEALFNYKPDVVHEAKSDVLHLCKIYNELEDILRTGRMAGNIQQLELI
jgi:hypothetical protein